MRRIDIAVVCHQVNKAYCESIGDNSQVDWDDAPVWQWESALNGVNLHLDNKGVGPEASHESWMAEKIEAGWVYGVIKDPDNKKHPCIIPFDKLPKEQQAKDYIFRAVVLSLGEL